MWLQNGWTWWTRCIVPLDFHVAIAVCISECIKLFDETSPFWESRATRLLVDKPTIEAHILSDFIQFLGKDVRAILLGKHFTNPSLVSSESIRREEYLTERFHTTLVSSICRWCWWRNNNTLAGRTCPINEFIHILPVSWLVSQEVVSTLRWARTTCREKNGCITYLSLIELVFIGFHQGRLLETFCQWHLRTVELGILVSFWGPVLDVFRMPATTIRLLSTCCTSKYNGEHCNAKKSI